MIAVSNPQLRPETGVRIAKYSQWDMDLLDLEENDLVTRPVADVLTERNYPNLHLLVSLLADGYLIDPFTSRMDGSLQKLVLTFNQLIARTDFIKIMGDMLERLENVYGHPLDTEFTGAVDTDGRVRINLLQCRPMRTPGSYGPVSIPDSIPTAQILFKSDRIINGGTIADIRYILYIDPEKYTMVESMDIKKSLGRIVGLLNENPLMIQGKMILMGPGRWGSSNIDLGVNVSYADINHTSVLVEIAREEAGQVPEVSYGTHFFLDLVEAQIIYMPVYPDDPEAYFNHAFFRDAPGILPELLPDAAKFRDLIHVIDLPAATGGKYGNVVADPQSQKAICFLE